MNSYNPQNKQQFKKPLHIHGGLKNINSPFFSISVMFGSITGHIKMRFYLVVVKPSSSQRCKKYRSCNFELYLGFFYRKHSSYKCILEFHFQHFWICLFTVQVIPWCLQKEGKLCKCEGILTSPTAY